MRKEPDVSWRSHSSGGLQRHNYRELKGPEPTLTIRFISKKGFKSNPEGREDNWSTTEELETEGSASHSTFGNQPQVNLQLCWVNMEL